MLDAFYDGKNYEGMRVSLQRNEEFKKGIGNVFIFPDDFNYANRILQVIRTPIEIRLEVRGANGELVHIDQQH